MGTEAVLIARSKNDGDFLNTGCVRSKALLAPDLSKLIG